MDEYYVTISEKIQRKEKHTQEEIHRKIGAVLHQHLYSDSMWDLTSISIDIPRSFPCPHRRYICSHLRLQRSLSWTQRLLMAWTRSQHVQQLRMQRLQRVKEQAKRVRFGDVLTVLFVGKTIYNYIRFTKHIMTTCLNLWGICLFGLKSADWNFKLPVNKLSNQSPWADQDYLEEVFGLNVAKDWQDKIPPERLEGQLCRKYSHDNVTSSTLFELFIGYKGFFDLHGFHSWHLWSGICVDSIMVVSSKECILAGEANRKNGCWVWQV